MLENNFSVGAAEMQKSATFFQGFVPISASLLVDPAARLCTNSNRHTQHHAIITLAVGC